MSFSAKDLEVIKRFWEDEIIATNVYSFLKRKVKGEKKEIFDKLSGMEMGHARIWENLAKEKFNKEFKVGLTLRIKVFFYKVLAIILPLTFMINYLELGERTATLEYSTLLTKFKNEPKIYEVVKKIIYEEIEHETMFLEMIIGERSKLARVKEAIYGMTDSLVEILALVIGLASVTKSPLTIGLAGLIAAIGGTFSMTSGAYLSAKSQNDLYEGAVRELDVKDMVARSLLLKDLKLVLEEKGVDRDAVSEIIDGLKENPKALKNLVKSVAIEETPTNPKEVAFTTGIYYIIGALPAILPFLFGDFFPVNTVFIAIIAIVLSSIVSFLAGMFTAILSGTKIIRKALENVLIIIGATLATYTIGSIAKVLLGISV